MVNVECYSAPQLFRLPYQQPMIVEDLKNVCVFAIESQSEDESCYFLTFIDTRLIVLYASRPVIYSANESLKAISFACVLLFTFLLMARKYCTFYRELKRYSLFSRNVSEFLCTVSTYVV